MATTHINEKNVSKFVQDLGLNNYTFNQSESFIAKQLVHICLDREISISCIESCTGGSISSEIVNIPNASKIFKGSIVAYSNEAKLNLLSIPTTLLENQQVYSENTAMQMAIKSKTIFNSDIAISTTGITGPDGGSSKFPVGLMHIGTSSSQNDLFKVNFKGNRIELKNKFKEFALLTFYYVVKTNFNEK